MNAEEKMRKVLALEEYLKKEFDAQGYATVTLSDQEQKVVMFTDYSIIITNYRKEISDSCDWMFVYPFVNNGHIFDIIDRITWEAHPAIKEII